MQVQQTKLDESVVKAICNEYRINSADIRLNCDATEDDIIDVIEGNRYYPHCLFTFESFSLL
jgi:ribosome-interacting GTPase 1